MAEATPNVPLRRWREAEKLSRADFAQQINLSKNGLHHHLTCDEERVRRWEAGEVRWPREPYRLAITDVTGKSPEDLGFVPNRRGPKITHVEEGDVRRREFVGLTGAALFSAVVGTVEDSPKVGTDLEPLAGALVDYALPADGPIDLGALSAAVVAAKQNYQACQYAKVTAALPGLLRTARAACSRLTGDDQLRAYVLSAEAHHVAASILLKQEDKGLAWLAADRSVQAAYASQSPLMIGSSSRIITHALMDGGHHRAATDATRAAAVRMQADMRDPTDDELSIYGSLLLRGSIAAAHSGERHNIAELLDEAADAGERLGRDGNHMWTAFGPNNVLCHRVNIALRLGDAGTAIDYARQVQIDQLPINERKATLLLDTSTAFLQCGKHEQALHVLRAAEQIAPEEVTGRVAAHRLIRDILATAPISVRREAREYAASLGVHA
ncbi:helix-turn-helix domain-containing protein [Nonomuraea sp. NPDC059007]|uniref:helix-turn-helix domain-containing protein n=1 Tax=Nonomuraea sp. NPDC059007 TaxID=3346692 RepID=UPI0036A14F82